jgi:hypothetical protein
LNTHIIIRYIFTFNLFDTNEINLMYIFDFYNSTKRKVLCPSFI